MVRVGIGVALALLAAGAAAAQPYNGATKLAHGDYAGAEKQIVAERAQGDGVDLQLNLATLYASTGRSAQARALYQQVAAEPDEQVALRDGRWTSSRALAARGLALTPTTLATR